MQREEPTQTQFLPFPHRSILLQSTFSWPSLDFFQYIQISLVLGSLKLETSPVLNGEDGSSPLTCWQYSLSTPRYHQPPLPQEPFLAHVQLAVSTGNLRVLFLPICFPAVFQLFSPQLVLLHRLVHPQVQEFSLASQGSSGWQHNPLVYRPTLSSMCHQQPCCGYPLPHHPDH